MTIFFYTCVPQKKLHNLTARRKSPIFLKMHACRRCARLWATSDFVPRSGLGTPGGTGYVATRPTCGPFLILSPTLKRWGPPRRQGLCSHPAHLWANSDSVSRSEVLGTPDSKGLCSHPAHLWTTFDFVPRLWFSQLEHRKAGGGAPSLFFRCGPRPNGSRFCGLCSRHC